MNCQFFSERGAKVPRQELLPPLPSLAPPPLKRMLLAWNDSISPPQVLSVPWSFWLFKRRPILKPARTEEKLGQFGPGLNLKRGPRSHMQEGPRTLAQERLPRHTDQFISFRFQMKITQWALTQWALTQWARTGHACLYRNSYLQALR